MTREPSKRSGRADKPAPRRRASGRASPRLGGSNSSDERAPGRGKYDRSRSAADRQKEQLRRLLDASAHVFAEIGWADATVEAIVSRAGMSRRTFYEHFDDLRDCLLMLHRKATKLAFRAVEARVEAEVETREMLRVGVEAFLGGIAMFPHLARVIFRVVRSAGPEFEAVHDQMLQRFAKLVHDGVAQAHAAGHATLPPDDLRVFALVSAMEAVAMRYVSRGEEERALEAAPVLVDMVHRSFA